MTASDDGRRLTAVSFDFDGLVTDTEGCYFQATAEVYRRHGSRLTVEEWAPTVGWADDDDWIDSLRAGLGPEVAAGLDAPALLAERRALDAECRSHLTPNPGVVALMADARGAGLRVAIASNSTASWIMEHLERFGIVDLVDVIVGGEVVPTRKPAPDIDEHLLAELGARPDQMIALEDSQPGVLAAKAAGLVCVAVPNGITQHTDLSAADIVLDSLVEVTVAELEGWAHAFAGGAAPSP